ncbi:unnamed protein product [Closterium sp. NIES-64]|nr:unnamed protein product [Closterium sp. NIES-64]
MRSAGSAGKGGRAKSNWPDTPNAFQTLAPRKRDEPSPFSPWLARALLFLPGLATGFILGRLLGGSGGSGKAAGGKKGELTAGGEGSSSGRKGGGGSAGGRSAPAFGGKAETEGAGGLVVGRGSELKMVLVVRQDLKMSSGKIAAQCARECCPAPQKEHGVVVGRGSELEMVLVIQQDLKMSSGKIAAQCANAAVGILTDLQTSNKALLRHYEACGQPKIVVSCSNLKEMNELRGKAQQHRLPVFTVCDAGRTQVAAGSKTVLAVGPGPCSLASFHLSLPPTHYSCSSLAPPPSPRLLPHHTSSLTTPPPLPRLLPYHASSLTTPPPLPRLLPYHAPNLQPPFNPPSEFPPSLAPPHRNSPFTEPFTALLPV